MREGGSSMREGEASAEPQRLGGSLACLALPRQRRNGSAVMVRRLGLGG
jgi:hypothetical protein